MGDLVTRCLLTRMPAYGTCLHNPVTALLNDPVYASCDCVALALAVFRIVALLLTVADDGAPALLHPVR
jgi:hypothetical protein